MINDNMKSVTQRIARACEKAGRVASDVKLVCVTKEASIEKTREVITCGADILGENRVQDAFNKHAIINDTISWHLIGHLQTNKVRTAVGLFDLIHSVDSLRLAAKIDSEAGKIGKRQDILIEVNVSGEAAKFGISPDDLTDLLGSISSFNNIIVKGLMTMAPEAPDPEKARPFFKKLKEIRNSIDRTWDLSMGMSNDFEVAIEEGATLVRIGRAIFKA